GDLRAVVADRDVRVDPAEVEELAALPDLADRAVVALAALGRPGHGDALPDPEPLDVGAHPDDLTDRGVAEDRRRDLVELALPVLHVGRAERRRVRLDDDPLRVVGLPFDLFDRERLVDGPQYAGPASDRHESSMIGYLSNDSLT